MNPEEKLKYYEKKIIYHLKKVDEFGKKRNKLIEENDLNEKGPIILYHIGEPPTGEPPTSFKRPKWVGEVQTVFQTAQEY